MARFWYYMAACVVFAVVAAWGLPHALGGMEGLLARQTHTALHRYQMDDVKTQVVGQTVLLAFTADTPADPATTARDRMAMAAGLARSVPGHFNIPFFRRGPFGGWFLGPVTRVRVDDTSVRDLQARIDTVANEDRMRAQAGAEDVAPEVAEAARACTDEVTAAVARRKLSFVSGSAELDGDSAAILDDVAETVRSCQGTLVLHVDGFTDTVGSAADNETLSAARASAAATALVTRGLPAPQVIAQGYGATQPIASNTTDAGRAQNRRVTFTLRPS